MINKFSCNRIVSYGCSITAGSELTDHNFFDMTDEELFAYVKKNKITGPAPLYKSLRTSHKTIEDIRLHNLTKSWPNFIAKKYDKPLCNRAIQGTSISDATYRILSDLHYSTIKSDDLILVGVTSPYRWFQFFETGDCGSGVFGKSWETRFNHDYTTQIEHNWVNFYNIAYTHFKELMILSNLSERLDGRIKLCYVFGKDTFLHHFPKEMKDKKFSEFYNFCVSMVPTCNDIDPTPLVKLPGGSPRNFSSHHVFGHPRIEYHEQYANLVIEKLEQMYSG